MLVAQYTHFDVNDVDARADVDFELRSLETNRMEMWIENRRIGPELPKLLRVEKNKCKRLYTVFATHKQQEVIKIWNEHIDRDEKDREKNNIPIAQRCNSYSHIFTFECWRKHQMKSFQMDLNYLVFFLVFCTKRRGKSSQSHA